MTHRRGRHPERGNDAPGTRCGTTSATSVGNSRHRSGMRSRTATHSLAGYDGRRRAHSPSVAWSGSGASRVAPARCEARFPAGSWPGCAPAAARSWWRWPGRAHPRQNGRHPASTPGYGRHGRRKSALGTSHSEAQRARGRNSAIHPLLERAEQATPAASHRARDGVPIPMAGPIEGIEQLRRDALFALFNRAHRRVLEQANRHADRVPRHPIELGGQLARAEI